MRFGPWWLFPVYILVWICFLPLWIVLALIRAATRRREHQRDVVRVTVRIQEHDETDMNRIITAGDGHGFSIRLTLGEYRKWAKLATSCDQEAADAYLMEIAGRALRHENAEAQEREEAPTQPEEG